MTSSLSSNIEILESVAPLVTRYSAVLCDVWGVVHNGVEAIVPACAALRTMHDTGIPVFLLTNAPRPWPDITPVVTGIDKPELMEMIGKFGPCLAMGTAVAKPMRVDIEGFLNDDKALRTRHGGEGGRNEGPALSLVTTVPKNSDDDTGPGAA